MIRTRSIDNYLIFSAFFADFIAGFFQNSAAHAYMINSANRMPSKIRFRNRATFHDMENRLIAVRLSAQQLSDPRFDDPRALVRWMGAVQAQDYKAVRWAVGIRLRTASLRAVDRALERGEILRTHVMRPTWHLVAAEDIRWMLRLSARRIRSANSSLARSRGLGIDDGMYYRSNRLIEKMLRGNLCLTKRQIADRFQAAGIAADTHFMTRYLMRAEADGIVCSGPDRAGQFTYALLEERVAPVPELTRDESLGRLARAYFRSHSPATASDFAWWSGLSASDVRAAIGSIRDELETLRLGDRERLIHRSWTDFPAPAPALHLLPPYDEYLIGYRDREPVLRAEHAPAAHNRWGIFYPVVLAAGRVAGNWSAARREGRPIAEVSFFDSSGPADPALVEQAVGRYRAFFER